MNHELQPGTVGSLVGGLPLKEDGLGFLAILLQIFARCRTNHERTSWCESRNRLARMSMLQIYI